MQKKSMGFKIKERNLKMKSEQNRLSGNVVEWNDLHPVFSFFFNVVNIGLISLNSKTSAEMLVLMSCGSFEMLFFVVAVATTVVHRGRI